MVKVMFRLISDVYLYLPRWLPEFYARAETLSARGPASPANAADQHKGPDHLHPLLCDSGNSSFDLQLESVCRAYGTLPLFHVLRSQ